MTWWEYSRHIIMWEQIKIVAAAVVCWDDVRWPNNASERAGIYIWLVSFTDILVNCYTSIRFGNSYGSKVNWKIWWEPKVCIQFWNCSGILYWPSYTMYSTIYIVKKHIKVCTLDKSKLFQTTHNELKRGKKSILAGQCTVCRND